MRVDTTSGYRFYQASQLERARLVAALRELQVPLAGIRAILGLEPEAAAERIGEYWAEFPGLKLRTEPAHREAFVHLGPGGQIGAAQWQLAFEALRAWASEHRAHPSELGIRVTFLANAPVTEGSEPDCDVAVPVT